MKAFCSLAILLLCLGSARAQGFQASFNTVDPSSGELVVLDSLCGGTGHPIGDGTVVEIWWDRNPAGPGPEDTLAPICNHSPYCDEGSGPARTVNFNLFPFNGSVVNNVPGTFSSEYVSAFGDNPSPSRFYLKVCLGWRYYISRSVTFAAGEVADVYFGQSDWTCVTPHDTPCCILPRPPFNVHASEDSCTGILVSWNGPADATHYKVYRGNQLVGTTAGNATQFLDTNAPVSEPQLYDVQTENVCGRGMRSGSVTGIRPSTTLRILSPNGGDSWPVFQTDTVRWVTCGFVASILIEINRQFPEGVWETLTPIIPNRGFESVYMRDPLSDRCRMRVRGAGVAVEDISDNDFSLRAVQGYVTLVRSAAPDLPVLDWSAGELECPRIAREWFRLKNFGGESAIIFRPPDPVLPEFSLTANCDDEFVLERDAMSPCSLQLTFDPESDGTFYDTLQIPTNAINGSNGRVFIPLTGSQITTPSVPGVAIRSIDRDIQLTWRPVNLSIGGCPVDISHYDVYYCRTPDGTYAYHGTTSSTTYLHPNVVLYADVLFYQVIACTGTTAVVDSPAGGN